MSMTTSVVGFVPPDEKWRKMKAIYDSCTSAGIDVPGAVLDFFDGKVPDPAGVEVDLNGLIEKWSINSAEGYQIEIDKLPKSVKVLRFYNSW